MQNNNLFKDIIKQSQFLKMPKLLPVHEINNEYDIIKTRLDDRYLPNDYETATNILTTLNKTPEHERDIFPIEKYERLKKFVANYDEAKAQKHATELYIPPTKLTTKQQVTSAIIALNAGKTIDTGYELAKLLLEESKYIILEKGIHYLWNETKYKYEVCDVMDILTRIKNNYQSIIIADPSNKQKVINGIGIAGREQAYSIQELDTNQIQFRDTIININTEATTKATPTLFCTNPIPHKLGITTETPKFDKMFTEWVGAEQVIKLYEMLAYCILRDYPLHKIFYLLGEGANGKSTFLKVIAKFVGEDNVCSTSLTLLSNDFGTSALHRKLVCQMGETNADKLESTDLLKKLTGEDLVPIQYKHKDLFNYRNYAKLIIATNHLPETSDLSDGWSRRCIIIDFPNQFDGKIDPLLDITEEDWENLALKALKTLQRILKNREFDKEGTIAEKRARYRSKSNPLEAFLNENYDLTFDEDQKIACGEVLANFHDFLRERKINVDNWNYRRVSNYMKAKGIKTDKQYSIQTKTDIWHYLGLLRKVRTGQNTTISTNSTLSTFTYTHRDKSEYGGDDSDGRDSENKNIDDVRTMPSLALEHIYSSSMEDNSSSNNLDSGSNNLYTPEYILENIDSNIVDSSSQDFNHIENNSEKILNETDVRTKINANTLFEHFKKCGYEPQNLEEIKALGITDKQISKWMEQGIIFENPSGIINLTR